MAITVSDKGRPSRHAGEFKRRTEVALNSESHAIVLAMHHRPVQEHGNEIPSVAIAIIGDFNRGRFDRWFDHLLQAQGADTFRMEGVLSFNGKACRFVFQAGHMRFEDHSGCPRESGRHENRLFFLGRNLNSDQLYRGLRSCLARRAEISSRSAGFLFEAASRIGSWFHVHFQHLQSADSDGGRQVRRAVFPG